MTIAIVQDPVINITSIHLNSYKYIRNPYSFEKRTSSVIKIDFEKLKLANFSKLISVFDFSTFHARIYLMSMRELRSREK